MPTTECPDCGGPVSTLAAACPRCGRPARPPATTARGGGGAAGYVSFPAGAVVAGIGGGSALAGVILTWSNWVSGWDFEPAYGKMVAMLGALAVVLALLWGARADRPMPPILAAGRELGSAEVFLALTGALIMVLCFMAGLHIVDSRSCITLGSQTACSSIDIEPALWLDGVAGALVFAGGVMGLAPERR